MAVDKSIVAELFVSYLGRAPSGEALTYWSEKAFDGNPTPDKIAQSFTDQDEFHKLYGNLEDLVGDKGKIADFVDEVFENTFERHAKPEGITYWTDQIFEGKISLANAVLAIINGAQDTSTFKDKTTLSNKTAAAEYFAEKFVSPDSVDASEAKQAIDDVTSDPATLKAAENAIDQWAKGAATTEFTTARDTLVGTDGDDIFSGDWTGKASTSTYQGFDAADGKDGKDTLTITHTAGAVAGITQAATISNIEELHLIQNSTNPFNVDVTNFDASITDIKVDSSTSGTGTITIGTAGSATGDLLKSIANIELNGLAAGPNTVTVNYAAAAVVGNKDAATIKLDNGVASTVTTQGATAKSAAIEHYTIETASGTQTLTLNDAGLGTTNGEVDIKGAGNLNLTLGTATHKIDASSATGNLTFGAAVLAAAGDKMTLGSGNDTANAIKAGAIVHGGAGNDTLTSTGANTQLYGDAGKDTLTSAGKAGELLDGGAGADTITSKAATDVIKYDLHTDSTSTAMDSVALSGAKAGVINVTEAIRASQGDSAVTGAAIGAANFVAAKGALTEGGAYVGTGAKAGVTHAYLDTANNHLYIDVNQDNKFNAADDLVINLSASVTQANIIV